MNKELTEYLIFNGPREEILLPVKLPVRLPQPR